MQTGSQTLEISTQSPLVEALKKALWLFSILFVLSLGLFGLGMVYGTQMSDAGHSASETRHEIIIANDVLSVPENMIRFEDQRAGGVAPRLDLYVHWPSQTGYSRDKAALFNETDPAKTELIFISLRPRDRVLEMRDRFGPVYLKAMEAEQRQLHDGLIKRQLKPALGYTDEFLAYAAQPGAASAQFVARCHDAQEQSLIAACETEIFALRSLEAEIRFPAHMLSQWQTLPAELSVFLAALGVHSGS